MSEKTKQLILNIDAGPDADAEEKELAARQLREELMQLDIESIDFVRAGQVPVKAKPGDPIVWGTLLIAAAVSACVGGVITNLIGALRSWLTRNNQRSITLEIDGDKLELKGISSTEQQRLTNLWVSSHSRRDSSND